MTGASAQVLAALLAAAALALLVRAAPESRLRPRPGSRPGPGRPGPPLAQAGPGSGPGRSRWPEPLRRNASDASRQATGHRHGPAPVPVVTDLVAVSLLTGLPPEVAVDAVAEALDAVGDPAAEVLRRKGPGFEPLVEALALAVATGLGPVPLVQAAGAQSRRRRAAAQQVAARRVGTLVVLPTGLCLLPAFVLLTVAPLVLDLVLG